jgi:hypothetical protein
VISTQFAIDKLYKKGSGPRFMETSIFVTDLAQQFSLSVVGPSHPVVVPLRVGPSTQGRIFLILGLSFLSRKTTIPQ